MNRFNDNREVKSKFQDLCFVHLIKNPPGLTSYPDSRKKIEYSEIKVGKDSNQKQQSSKLEFTQIKQTHVKLNLRKILKMPHRQFLYFFSSNQRLLVKLASDEEMRELLKYRDESLTRAEKIEDLKERIAQTSPWLIEILPAEKKEKLFAVLYSEVKE